MENIFYPQKSLVEFDTVNCRQNIASTICIVVVTIMSIGTAFSQCGCDHVIAPTDISGGIISRNGATMGVQPGDKVCIMAGSYTGRIELVNFQGTALNPILIINCSGQVVISNYVAHPAINVLNSKHFKISGRGHSEFDYGIKIDTTGQNGLSIGNLSTDFEVEGFDIGHTGFAGIISKTDPSCTTPDRRAFVQKNSIFHDNYIHHTHGEGFYVGYTAYPTSKKVCGSDTVILYPHRMEGVEIYNNIIEHTGWDGIQLGSTTKDGAIFGNTIRDHGTRNNAAHGHGIQLGNDVVCRVYNNKILPVSPGERSGYGNGIVSWAAVARVFNNLIVNPGNLEEPNKVGIQLYNNSNPLPDSSNYIINNTIINAARAGISMFHDNLNNKINNNIIVSQTGLYIIDAKPPKTDTTYNYRTSSITHPGFSDSEYHLSANSPCIGAGVNRYGDGVKFDMDNKPRPASGNFDQGVFQYEVNQTKTVKVDFRIITGPAPPSDWNDFTSFGTGATLTDLKYSDGELSGYDIEVAHGFSGANNSGETSGVYPSAVMQTAWFVNETNIAELTITGLDNNKKYDLKFFGSRDDANPLDRTTLYAAGGITDSLNASSNTSNIADILNISPTNGTITLTVANATGGEPFGYLNAMEILESVTEPETELKLDFRPTAGPVGPADWNALTNIGLGATKALNYSDGSTSGYSVEVTGPFSGVNASGVSASGVYPGPVMETAWYVSGTVEGQLTFSGLDEMKRYSFEFFGSRNDSGTPMDRNTQYLIGTAVETLNASNNATLVATIADVMPASGGTVIVKIKNAPNGESFGYLNAMRIIEGPGGAASAMMAQTEEPQQTFGDNTFSVHPMPYTNRVTVTFNEKIEGPVAITLKDIQGRTHFHKNDYQVVEGSSVEIDLSASSMPRGMGVIKVQTSKGYSRTLQIYKE